MNNTDSPHAFLDQDFKNNLLLGAQHTEVQLNEYIKQALSRRSYRQFKQEALPPAVLQSLAEVARWTASSTGQQRFSIIRLTDPLLKEKIAQFCRQDYLAQAPEWWIFIADCRRNALIAETKDAHLQHAASMDKFFQAFTDACLAAQHVASAAESLGLGTVFTGSIHNNDKELIKLLNLPKHCFPALGLSFGWPNQEPLQKPRIPQALRFFENSYDLNLSDNSALLKAYDEQMQDYYDLRDPNRRLESFSLQAKNSVEGFDPVREQILKSIFSQGFTEI